MSDLESGSKSESGSTNASDPRRDLPRMGAEPFRWSKYCAIAEKPSKCGINDITVALHISFNRMLQIRKIARALLRAETGHTAKETRRIRANLPPYQEPGQRLQAWQEDRSSFVSSELKCLCIYGKLTAECEEFQTRYDANGKPELPKEKPTQIDPAESTKEVRCANLDMKQDYVVCILNHEMAYMKKSELARDPLREDEIVCPYSHRGPQDECLLNQPVKGRRPNRKERKPEDRRIGIYLGGVPKASTKYHVIPSVSSLLRKPVDHYAPKDSFPYNDLGTTSLWNEVARIPSVGPDPARDGWLSYSAGGLTFDKNGSVVVKSPQWNVKTGEELGQLFQQHFEENKDKPKASFRSFILYYFKGSSPCLIAASIRAKTDVVWESAMSRLKSTDAGREQL